MKKKELEIIADTENTENGKFCFIITPISNNDSPERRKANGVINSVIKPLLQSNAHNFNNIKAAHEISESGSINSQIMNSIFDADLVIANLTNSNPNVMYELAVRHAIQKPIIHICEDNTKLPFDIIDQRTIFFTNDMQGVNELKKRLNEMLITINYNDLFSDNPIYKHRKDNQIIKEFNNFSKGSYDINKFTFEKLIDIERKLDLLSINTSHSMNDTISPFLDHNSSELNTQTFMIELVVSDTFDNNSFKNALINSLLMSKGIFAQIFKFNNSNYDNKKLIYQYKIIFENEPENIRINDIGEQIKSLNFVDISEIHSINKIE